MIPGSEVTVHDVGLNPTRTGFLEVLKRMGARIETQLTQKVPEPMGTIHVCGARLKGTGITHGEIPSLIDELPVLMVAMALAEGESLISGAAELRVKETDRIRSMSGILRPSERRSRSCRTDPSSGRGEVLWRDRREFWRSPDGDEPGCGKPCREGNDHGYGYGMHRHLLSRLYGTFQSSTEVLKFGLVLV